MKYYKELTHLETQIINLDVLKSVVRGLTPGIADCGREDIENTMWHLVDQIELRANALRADFNTLFDMIREDSFKEEADKNEAKGKKPRAKKSV